MRIAKQPTAQRSRQQRTTPSRIRIFSDSVAGLSRINNATDIENGQWLVDRILDRAKDLRERGTLVEFHWVPGRSGNGGNECADEAAKEAAARRQPKVSERFASVAHVQRQITVRRTDSGKAWFGEGCRNVGEHRPRVLDIDHTAMKGLKRLVAR